MRTFPAALDDENQRVYVLAHGETADPCANAVFIGPGAVDLMAGGDSAMLARQERIEAGKIKEWRRWDWGITNADGEKREGY